MNPRCCHVPCRFHAKEWDDLHQAVNPTPSERVPRDASNTGSQRSSQAKRPMAQPGLTNSYRAVRKRQASDTLQQMFDIMLCLMIACLRLPLHFVMTPMFRALILLLEPGINIPSSKELQRKKMPALAEEIATKCQALLKDVLGVALSFDLRMSRKTEDILAVECHFLSSTFQWHTIHLGLVSCTKGTSGSEVHPDLHHRPAGAFFAGNCVCTNLCHSFCI